MKKFLGISVLVLIFCFQSWAKADDIRDFEIDGMSVGDSLLEYFDKSEIDENKYYMYKSEKYAQYNYDLSNSNYENIVIEFKDSGNYSIGSINGRIFYNDNNFKNCSKTEKIILNELKKSFANNSNYINHGIDEHEMDVSGESKGTWHTFQLDDGSGWIYLECLNWSKKFNSDGFKDELKVTILNVEFGNFLGNEAY